MEENPESNDKENRDGVESTENNTGNQNEVISLQVDQSKYQQEDLDHDNKMPFDEEVVTSLRNSLKSTPHSVVNKAISEKTENKGSGWKVWLPILCVVTIFFLVVIVVSVKSSPEPKEGTYTLKFICQRNVLNIYQSYIVSTNCFVKTLFINETLF